MTEHGTNLRAHYYAACAVAFTAFTGSAGAQDATTFPTRAVQIVVPYSTGTTADILARLLGPKLSERWKVSVITDNRPGATGAIGLASVAKSAPDGHTLTFVVTSYSMIPAIYKTLPFDPVKSFAPVVRLTTSGLALVVHPQVPVKTVREFVQLAQRRPGELFYSSPGNGSAQHLAMELFKLEVETWSGALAPAATPAAVITKLNADINALLQQTDIREQFTRQGMNPTGGPAERFGDLLKSELARWTRVVEAAKIRID